MFFRREKPKTVTFDEQLAKLQAAGFAVDRQGSNGVRVTRGVCAADVTPEPFIRKAGVLVGGEIADLVDVGYQKQLWTPGGKKMPARAEHLKAMHQFEEDLWEALGQTSLYNQSLGTRNDAHLYDRVQGRER